MTVRVNVTEAADDLSGLIDCALAGEAVVIERSGEPVVGLVPIRRASVDRSASRGAWRGRVRIAEDFDSGRTICGRPSASTTPPERPPSPPEQTRWRTYRGAGPQNVRGRDPAAARDR